MLVVEDDPHVREAVERALRFEGYDVHTAVDGNDALLRVDELAPDAIVLDVLMPGTDGLAVCRILRDRGNHTPVLMLTARHEVSDRVAGLDAGADDYLVKPFALDELFARVRALLRRSSITDGDATLTVADLVLDPTRRQAWRAGRELELTKTEFDLLELLMFNAGIVVTRELDLRTHLGLRLRDVVEVARRLHRLPAPQDRDRRRGRASSTRSAAIGYTVRAP